MVISKLWASLSSNMTGKYVTDVYVRTYVCMYVRTYVCEKNVAFLVEGYVFYFIKNI
jgi:hypothetical protein